MAYKLTGDQTERVFDNLRFLQDIILHLEDDSVKKEAKAAQREKELMENNAGEVYLRGFYYSISYLYIKTFACSKVNCDCRTLQLLCANYRANRTEIVQSSLSDEDWT